MGQFQPFPFIMSMWNAYALLIWAASMLLSGSSIVTSQTGDRIWFAMDSRSGLNPEFKSSLFNLRIISNSSMVSRDIDLLVHANWSNVMLMYYHTGVDLPAYSSGNNRAVALFDSKIVWKNWMHKIGLGTYVPRTYDFNITTRDTSGIPFPVILKLNKHFGTGVFVVHTPKQLLKLLLAVVKKDMMYSIEEALTGMGLAEVSSYGSVYKGRLISMRCIKRHFPPKNAARTAHYWYDGNFTVAQPMDAFVRGFMMNSRHDTYIPCSQELINVTRVMFEAAPMYTGFFCADIKSDADDQFKMMEINARFCGSMARNPYIFTAALVPLAFAVHKDNYVRIAAMQPVSWPVNPTYLAILKSEQTVMQSGGGIIDGRLVAVQKFNHTMVVDKPEYSVD